MDTCARIAQLEDVISRTPSNPKAWVHARPVPTQPGDVVFFDSYTPHASGPNLTAEPRRVLYITYNRLSAGDHRARYYADKRQNFPPDIERDPTKTYTFRV